MSNTLADVLYAAPAQNTAVILPDANIRLTYAQLREPAMMIADTLIGLDIGSGRPMEIEAVAGAVVELGDRLGVPMPHTRAAYASARIARGAN